MRGHRIRRGRAWLATHSVQAALARRSETPQERAERRRERVREAFWDARDELRIVLEDLIEEQARTTCPTATDLDVEVYADELGELRGRLVAVNTATGPADEDHDAVVDGIAELLDEWATVANVDSTEIWFRPLSVPSPTWGLGTEVEGDNRR